MQTPISAPEKFVIIALLAFGGIALLATPLSAGYDEETHFIRAWEMAHLHFIPNEQLGSRLPFPAIYWDLSYRRQPIVEAVDADLWSRYGSLPMDAHDYIYANVETRSVYSPALLLPQALAIRYLGLSLQLPALAVYYGCRLAGLLAYVLLSWLAVRFIPYGKWLLAVLILSPMAVFQASTISADTISNGIAFLFLGATLGLARGAQFGWRQWLIQLGLLALLFLGKVNLVFLALLPFLVLPWSRSRMRYGLVLLAAAAVALFAIEVVGWNAVAYSRFTRALEGADPRGQMQFILANPLLFVSIIARDIWTNTGAYLRGWVGVYGYNYWPVPGLTYLLFPLAAIVALRPAKTEVPPDTRTRWILLLLFAVGFLLTIVSLYVAFTPVRSLIVAGVQGRYFTVVMPLLLLALLGLGPSGGNDAGSDLRKPSRYDRMEIAVALSLGSLLLYSLGLLLSYHIPCGSEYYRWSLCYQPQYKNWAPEAVSSPPLAPSLTLSQEIVPTCNGMSELRVWVNSAGIEAGSRTTLTLRAPTQEKDVLRRTFRNVDLAIPGWLTVEFPPEWNSSGQLYLLSASGSSPGGLRLGYSEKAEYGAGKLLENDVALGQDLLFQYGCIAGIQRLVGVGR